MSGAPRSGGRQQTIDRQMDSLSSPASDSAARIDNFVKETPGTGSPMQLKVLIADDHSLLRQGLRQLLADENPDYEFAEADGFDATLTALADGGTVYLLTFSELTQTFGPWSYTRGVLNDETIAAGGGAVFIVGRDSSDRIYWYGPNWFFAGGAGISSTVLAGGK